MATVDRRHYAADGSVRARVHFDEEVASSHNTDVAATDSVADDEAAVLTDASAGLEEAPAAVAPATDMAPAATAPAATATTAPATAPATAIVPAATSATGVEGETGDIERDLQQLPPAPLPPPAPLLRPALPLSSRSATADAAAASAASATADADATHTSTQTDSSSSNSSRSTGVGGASPAVVRREAKVKSSPRTVRPPRPISAKSLPMVAGPNSERSQPAASAGPSSERRQTRAEMRVKRRSRSFDLPRPDKQDGAALAVAAKSDGGALTVTTKRNGQQRTSEQRYLPEYVLHARTQPKSTRHSAADRTREGTVTHPSSSSRSRSHSVGSSSSGQNSSFAPPTMRSLFWVRRYV
jgi:hypothetical protein